MRSYEPYFSKGLALVDYVDPEIRVCQSPKIWNVIHLAYQQPGPGLARFRMLDHIA